MNTHGQVYRIEPCTGTREPINDVPFVILNNVLGKGTQGIIYLGLYEGKKIAIKQVLIKFPEEKERETGILNEARILSTLNHPNIIKYIDFYCDFIYYYLILEYIDGTDLYEYVIKNFDCGYSGANINKIILDIAKTIGYLHNNNYVHMDIKLENIMLTNDNQVKLIDFAFGRNNVEDNDTFTSIYCGSVFYADPDLIKRNKYNAKCADIWSFGVTIFSIMTQNNLFGIRDKKIFAEFIVNNRSINLNNLHLMHYKQLFEKIFVYDFNMRPGINEILLILENIDIDLLNHKVVSKTIQNNLSF